MENNIYVFSPYNGLEKVEGLKEAKKFILDSCIDAEEGIHPDAEDFLILQSVLKVVVKPNDEEEFYTINFEDL